MFRIRRALRPFVFAVIASALAAPDALRAQQAEEEDTWDVAASFGPTRTISFETSEATWVNVTASADDRTLVFDVLGDLYMMPIDGGAARRITSGPAYDMQPRFSPDGSTIAYISDAGGAHNVWLMDADGTNPRQLSKERQRLVNSPAWSADGRYIFARKHFVESRSLGAGEVWMYHVSGGDGLQVTERNGWQKDAGEPAISPDGRYLYYSKDVTPGQTFEYNKDPYGVIYAIIRRDLRTGEEEQYVRRPGGSITPLPSPDGARLAFIRRVDLETVLFLKDVETGREWPVFDRLDRDMQEAWAIHGVYPQYAWLSDNRTIVIWGEGKLWRVDTDTRDYSEIPYTVHVEQEVHEPLRFPVDVAPDEFSVRMLRDVTTSPDGRTVAYSALGKIYVKSMPDGAPRRLTRSNDTEAAPAFSPDGRSIVYTTWSDSAAGRVRITRLDGSATRDVVRTPGHYTDASFSPDGHWIVYRAVGEDDVRTLLYGENPGVFVVAASGEGEPRRVTDNGNEPEFDHTGERIYLRGRRNDKFALYSVDLNGGDEIVHLQSANATQIEPSPDGRWVAFAERYHAYVAAFPRTGRAVDIGPRVSGFPVAQISRDAGMYIHWSADGGRVHWALGPDYFTRPLDRTFAFLMDGDSVQPAEPEAGGVPIGFTVESDKPEGVIALTGARIITMADSGSATSRVIENGTIVIRSNRIETVGSAASVTVPAGAQTIDVAGRTIMPGIIDVHGHFGGGSAGIIEQTSWPLLANLAFGVTTSHDPSNDTETVFTNVEMARAGLKLAPRLFSTGTILYGAETPFKAVVENYEDALSHLRRMKAVGAVSVKSYNHQRRDARQMIVKAGRELGIMVVPEGGSLYYFNATHIIDGHTGVEHSLPVPVLYDDIVTLFAQSGVGYTPTAIVGYGGLSGEFYFYQHMDVWRHELLNRFTPRDVVLPRSRRRIMAADDDWNHIRIMAGAKRLFDEGGLVQLGAHGQLQGLGAHWELWMFEQGGMEPIEALEVATLSGARYLGMDADIGSLEPGKLADLIVLERNPLENIRNTDSVQMIMLNGRLFDAATLTELGGRDKWAARGTLPWERAIY